MSVTASKLLLQRAKDTIERLRHSGAIVFVCALFALCLTINPLPLAAAVYLSPQKFISHALPADAKPKVLWLSKQQQDAAKKILGHKYRGLRLRYWRHQDTTAWIIDEIGKDKPITIGVVIEAEQIKAVKILTYREPRGGEVRHPFFTRQYLGLSLEENNKLSGHIDGVSGATLSVRAVTNVTRYALYLNSLVATTHSNNTSD